MAYPKRVWTPSPLEEVTYKDFNRIEGGVSTNDENIASQGQQLSILKGDIDCPFVTFPDGNLITYGNDLPVGVHRTIQFNGALDTPTASWYYAEIYKHASTGYVKYVLHDLINPTKSYFGGVANNVWSGWKEIATTSKIDISPFLKNGWIQQNNSYDSSLVVTGKHVDISCLLANPAQGTSNKIMAIVQPVPSKSQILHGLTNDGQNVLIAIDTGGNLTVIGTVPPHLWITITDGYNL